MYGLNNSLVGLQFLCDHPFTLQTNSQFSPFPGNLFRYSIRDTAKYWIGILFTNVFIYPHFIFFLFSPPPWLLFTTLTHRMGGYMDGSALPDPFVIQPPTVLVCSDFRNQCHNLWLSFRDTDAVSEVKRQHTYSHKANVAIYSNTMWAESISVHLCNLQYKLCCWIYSIPLKSRLMVVFIWF